MERTFQLYKEGADIVSKMVSVKMHSKEVKPVIYLLYEYRMFPGQASRNQVDITVAGNRLSFAKEALKTLLALSQKRL